MKVTLVSRAGLGLAAAIILSCSAFAAGVSPTSYPFILKGGGNLTKNSNTIWSCGWTFQMKTTSSSGGTMTGGVGDTNNNCNQFTVQPSTWSVTSATSGVFHGLVFSQNGGQYCATSSDVPFTIMTSGANISSFYFNSVNFNGCNYNANLSTGAALTVTP